MRRAMAEAVSLRHGTAEARVRSHVSPCEICGGQGNVTVFSPSTWVFPLSIIIPTMLHTHLLLHSLLPRVQCARNGNFPKRFALSEIREHWIRKYFHLFRLERVNGQLRYYIQTTILMKLRHTAQS
jgi:hypothetical protein